MVLPAIYHSEGHPSTKDVTVQITPEQIESRFPNSTKVCPCTGTIPVGYTIIEFNRHDDSNPASALVTEVCAPPTAGKMTHWRYVFLADTSFGVGMALEYGQGWGQRGEYLNSSNGALCGRGLLVSSWVPSFVRAGAQVDIMIEVVDSHVKAYIALDRMPQGLAFDLDFSARPGAIAQLHPMVICHGEADGARVAVFQFAPGVPNDAYKLRKVDINPACPAGEYLMGSEQFPGVKFPDHKAKIQVRPGGGLSFHVFNNFNNGATLQPDGSVIIGDQAGPGVTTLMMPPPEFEAAERTVKEWIRELRHWSFSDNKLTLNDRTFPVNSEFGFVTQNDLL